MNTPLSNQRITTRTMLLFIAEGENISCLAADNLKQFNESYLDDSWNIEIINVFEDFQTAIDYNVMVTPTLIVTEPEPGFTILGDLRNTGRLKRAFGIQ